MLPQPDPAQRRAVEADLRRPRSRDPRPQARAARRGDPLPVPGGPGRPGPQGGARRRPRQGVGGDPRRRAHHRAVRPRVQRAAGADPVAAERLGRAPPPGARPHPHPGRARRRGGRRPRGAPHGRAWSASAPPRSTRTWRSSPSRTWSTAASSPASPATQAKANYVKAAGKGVLKVMSKMGISTLASYTGAQLFQAIGISQSVLDEYFTGLSCPVGGIDLDDIADDVATRHALAYLDRPDERAHRELEVGGEYQWRREGEYHLFNPDTVFKLQHATRTGQYSIFKEYTKLIDDQSERMASLRGLLKFQRRRAPAGAARRGRAGQRDRQAVLHRRDELRLDLRRGARDAGHRDEPPWRPVELGRGRRGRQPLRPRRERRLAPQRDQAGGVRPVRRDQPLPDQLHRHPDQDGPGRETR